MRNTLIFCVALACAPIAAAQQAVSPLVKDLRANLSRADYLAAELKKFDSAARKRTEITAGDLDLRDKAHRAEQRASYIALVMRNDLNGDNRVTRAEIEDADRAAISELRPEEVFAQFDANTDGVVEFKDLDTLVATKLRPDSRTEWLRSLMAMPEGRDKTLDREEISAMAERTFATADANADGWIDRAELQIARPSELPRPPVTLRPRPAQ